MGAWLGAAENRKRGTPSIRKRVRECGLRFPFLILATLVSLIQASAADAAGGATQGPGATSIPRTPDGKPDLSGIWQVLNTAAWDIQDRSARKDVPAGQGVVEGNEIPYQPGALARKKENYEQRATLDPETKCYLPGVPRIMYMPFPFQIIQRPHELTLLFEYVHAVRYIFTNGSKHPPVRSTGGSEIRAAAGRATRSWST